MHLDISQSAALIGDPTRAALLVALLDGRAQSSTALAKAAAVSPQAASNHLAKLVQGGLLAVEQAGRYRYYRLASAQVAGTLESLAGLSVLRPDRRDQPRLRADARLRFARTCYDHLAGRLGVAITDSLLAHGYLRLPAASGKVCELTDEGRRWCADFGIELQIGARRSLARMCLDWTEQRHHLAGAVGDQLLQRLRVLHWLVPARTGRSVRLTPAGQAGLREVLGLHVDVV